MKDGTDPTTCIASTALCDKYATEYWHRVMLLLWLLQVHIEKYILVSSFSQARNYGLLNSACIAVSNALYAMLMPFTNTR